MESYFINQMQSPFGDLGIAIDELGRVVRISFLKGRSRSKLLTNFNTFYKECQLTRDPSWTAHVERQLHEYFSGKRCCFDLKLKLVGTQFQRSVWGQVLAIPLGETRSYSEIAQRLGNPRAARAVGRANAKNPISIVIPCHRVVGSDGSLTGFAGGLPLKRRLLEFEAVRKRNHHLFPVPRLRSESPQRLRAENYYT